MAQKAKSTTKAPKVWRRYVVVANHVSVAAGATFTGNVQAPGRGRLVQVMGSSTASIDGFDFTFGAFQEAGAPERIIDVPGMGATTIGPARAPVKFNRYVANGKVQFIYTGTNTSGGALTYSFAFHFDRLLSDIVADLEEQN